MLHMMSRQQKAIKLVKKNDVIMELPDEIISQFISFLPFREAVRTSILSKSWISIWTTHMDVVCDVTNILGFSSSEFRGLGNLGRLYQRNKFVEHVDSVMQKRSKGPKMNSIVINFPLSQEHESHITSWITGAIMMGVEEINLDFKGWYHFAALDASSDIQEGYTFPFSVLSFPGQACTVKHLQLDSCSLSSLSISKSLGSLVTVKFQNVNFTDQQLDFMLCNCLFLERMIVESCPDIVNFRVTSRSSRLKFLAIKSCCRLKNIELYAKNLEILQCTGRIERFLFKHVPKLAEVFFNFSGRSRVRRVTYAPSRIANDVPRLEILNMVLIKLNSLPEGVTTLINIKHLVLTVLPFQDKDMLGWVTYILKTAPLLTKLQFNQFKSSLSRRSEPNDMLLPEVTHANLTELEINGYRGKEHEKELLKYLVDCAVKLDLLVISPRMKLYRGLNDWCYIELNSFDNRLSSEQIQELHSIVPKAVRVKYCD